MVDIDAVVSQVKRNCDISDAGYWGYYSPCGLLLRLRSLYRFEHALRPWEAISHERIKKWIAGKELLWSELEKRGPGRIEISGKSYAPFDSGRINAVLTEHGYVYSAGYGNMLKPVFAISKLEALVHKGRYRIYRTGRELARDLAATPAMIQGNTIFLREETMHHFLWDRYEEMRARKRGGALPLAFSEYGITRDSRPEKAREKIGLISADELETYVYHELGEASQRKHMGRWWKELVTAVPRSRAELMLRALKDIRADTCGAGMLAYIIEQRKTASLYFYTALLSGFRKVMFPELTAAFEEFVASGDWGVIERARGRGYRSSGTHVKKLRAMYENGTASAEAIEKELVPEWSG